MHVKFEEVKLSYVKKGSCTVCGKRRKRTHTVTHTVNPFNKDKDGIPKSREQVREDVEKKLKQWHKKPLVCKTCEDSSA